MFTQLIFVQDLHSVDLEEFKYGGTNITALRLLDPDRTDVQRVVRDWVYDEARKGRKNQLGHTTAKVKTNINVNNFLQKILPNLISTILFTG